MPPHRTIPIVWMLYFWDKGWNDRMIAKKLGRSEHGIRNLRDQLMLENTRSKYRYGGK